MATTEEVHDDAVATGNEPVRSVPVSGWRLIASAFLWSMGGSLAGGFLVGLFVGVVLGVTGLGTKIPDADRTTINLILGMLGSTPVLLTVALRKAAVAGGGKMSTGLGDGPIARRWVLALVVAAIVAYVAAINYGAFQASPARLQRMLAVDAWLMPVNLLFVVAVAPLVEELFFRGWLWTALRGRWSPLATAAATSVLWLALHLPDGGVVQVTLLMPLAVAVSLARHLGASVRAPIVVHVCNNLAASGAPWLYLWLGWLTPP